MEKTDQNNNYCSLPDDVNLDQIIINQQGENNKIIIGSNIKLFGAIRITIIGDNNTIHIKDNLIIKRNLHISIYPGGPRFKGNNCSVFIDEKSNFNGDNIVLECGEENTSISIGKECLFAKNIKITTTDNHTIYDCSTNERINAPGDVIIGNHVWFCENVTVLNNTRIGNESVVACNAIVTGKTFPNNVVIAGIPAKIIKNNINWKY